MSPPNTEWEDPIGVLNTWEDPIGVLKKPYEQLKAKAGKRGFTYAGRLVTDPTETPEQVLKRTPLGELESGGRAVTAPLDLAAGVGLSKLAVGAMASPRQTGRSVVEAFKRAPGAWRDFWQNIGENITSKVPGYFRAGRGTPLEFREARFQMESDIANRMEQAVSLGKQLTTGLSTTERLRADQLLRGSIVTGKTPEKIVAATQSMRGVIDEIQDKLVK